MTEPVWLLKPAVLATHKMMIAEFAGTAGLRDEGLLESALARPANLHHYENCDDLPGMAAAYAVPMLLKLSQQKLLKQLK